MSIIRAAEKYAEMEKAGLTIAQISAKTGVASNAIQERLQLLTLSADEQEKVKNNEMSYTQALKICEQRKQAKVRLKAREDATLHARECG
jgi:hypothetical protein